MDALPPNAAPVALTRQVVQRPSVTWPTAFVRIGDFIPGLWIATVVASAAFMFQRVPVVGILSPIALAMVLGMATRCAVEIPPEARAGVTFASRKLLRFAIVLLGLQISAGHVVQIGFAGIVIICSCMIATFIFTLWLGRVLKVDERLSQLIAAGTSICGASAILAANAVSPAKDEDVTYAIGCITLFGSIAIFTYPLIALAFHLDARAFGLWSGASIHEVAQVVAAAFQLGVQSGEFGTMAKLLRVILLIPMIMTLGLWALRRRGTQATSSPTRLSFPYFILWFAALVALNSFVAIPEAVKSWAAVATTALFALALAALGLEVHVRQLLSRGWAPLSLAALASLFIASTSLLAIKLAF